MSSDAKPNKLLIMINEKSEQLRTNGLTHDDQELLKNRRRERELSRLELVWGKEFDAQDSNTATPWRRSRARQVYRKIQDLDEHLFLAFVLIISPTDCISKSIGYIITYLDRLENYEPYRLKLSQATKRIFESTATDHGFADSPLYRNFMTALFTPNPESPQGPPSPNDNALNSYSPNTPSTSHSVLPRSLKRKGAPTETEYPGATGSDVFILSNNGGPGTSDGRPNNNRSDRETSTPSRATPTNTPQNETQREPTTIPAIAQKEKVYEKAPLQTLGQVFDRYMSSAIERVTVTTDGVTSLRAAVTMVFPSLGLLDCLMSFDIDASKVEYVAMALFNVRVESVKNVRYISMRGEVRMQPNHEIILKGVLDGPIIDVFGPEMHGAITACSMREKELEEGNDATDCVSMLVTSNPSEGATINLALGLEEGNQIRKKLYT